MAVQPHPAMAGQESVWSYPRPAVAEPCDRRIRILHRGRTILDSLLSIRTLETSHPPSYYVPRSDIDMALLRPNARRSLCEWKGEATYFDLLDASEPLLSVAWSYPDPGPGFEALQDHIAFYAGPFDACYVDEERVLPQQGRFYGGWITSHVAGPFKGAPGTSFW